MIFLDFPRHRFVQQLRQRKTNHITLHLKEILSDGGGAEFALRNYAPGPKFFGDDGERLFYFDDSTDKLNQNQLIQRHLYSLDLSTGQKSLVAEPTQLSLDVRGGKMAFWKGNSVLVTDQEGNLLFEKNMQPQKAGALSLSPDGSLLAVAQDPEIKVKTVSVSVFDLASEQILFHPQSEDDTAYDSNAIRVLRFTPDNQRLLVAGTNKNFFLFRLSDGTNEAATYPPEQVDYTKRLATHHNWYHYMDLDVSSDGKRMLLLTSYCKAFLYDLEKEERSHIFHFDLNGKGEKTARFTKEDGSEFIYAHSFGELEVVDIATREAFVEPVYEGAQTVAELYEASWAPAESGDWESCIDFLKQAYQAIPEPKGDFPDVYNIVNDLVQVFFRLKRFEEAWEWAETLYDCGKSRYDGGEREVNSGKIAFEQGHRKAALKYFGAAYKKSKHCFGSTDGYYKDFFMKHK